jgi:hypothetical protein
MKSIPLIFVAVFWFAANVVADETLPPRERLLMDFGWWITLENSANPSGNLDPAPAGLVFTVHPTPLRPLVPAR